MTLLEFCGMNFWDYWGFQSRGSLCFNVSIDDIKCENDQGSEENLWDTEVSKIVKLLTVG